MEIPLGTAIFYSSSTFRPASAAAIAARTARKFVPDDDHIGEVVEIPASIVHV